MIRILAAGLFSYLIFAASFAYAEDNVPTRLNVYAVKNTPKQRLYIEARSATEDEIIALRRRLMDEGAEKVNLFFLAVIVCEIPLELNPRNIIDGGRFSYIEESRIVSMGPSAVSAEVLRTKRYYDMARLMASREPSLAPPADFSDRVLVVPRAVVEKSKPRHVDGVPPSSTQERNVVQNSEFMIGDILIRSIYPESMGQGDSEDWSDQELRDATQGVVTGALAFQQKFNYLPMDFVFTSEERAPTMYEPIRYTSADDATTWIPDVMSNLGYGGAKEAALMVHDYNDDGRKRYGTDWVYTAFIANSENERGHVFAGNAGGAGYTAYAYLGGPYLVIPFPAGLTNPNQLDDVVLFSQIFQHEMVHIFWGLDEYQSAIAPCSAVTGYLDYPNRNKLSDSPTGQVIGCRDYDNCLMWNARAAVEDRRPICFYTAGQIGVVDANNNSIPDVFDIPPTVVFERAKVETVTVPKITLNMKAISQAVRNLNPMQADEDRRDYAAPLKDATLVIEGIGATGLDPVDGKWDETEEDLTFSVRGLSAGHTRIGVKVRNVFGATSDTLYKDIFLIGLKFGAFDLSVTRETIVVRWNTVDETFGAQFDLYRVEDDRGKADTVLVSPDVPGRTEPGTSFANFSYTDSDIRPGQEYHYFVVGHFTLDFRGELRFFETRSSFFGVYAMLPIEGGARVSQVAPNPFRESTTISIDIPRSFRGSDVDDPGGNSFGIRTEVPTEIAINVYDVKGRRVKEIYAGKLFARVETFTWDGTNSRNERVPSGVYFIKAQAGTVKEVRKVVIVR